jgi:hypothetical protein
MLNWSALYTLACQIYGLFVKHRTSTPATIPNSSESIVIVYDGKLGVVQYIAGSIALHIGLVALEGATLSLLSKISPLGSSRSVAMNVGSLVTIIGLSSKVFADANICFVDISQRMVNADIVNSMLVPTIICSLILSYYVKKNFFFLV